MSSDNLAKKIFDLFFAMIVINTFYRTCLLKSVMTLLERQNLRGTALTTLRLVKLQFFANWVKVYSGWDSDPQDFLALAANTLPIKLSWIIQSNNPISMVQLNRSPHVMDIYTIFTIYLWILRPERSHTVQTENPKLNVNPTKKQNKRTVYANNERQNILVCYLGQVHF